MDKNIESSSKDSVFFPVKSWLGGKHKKNGIYIEGDTVKVHKAGGYKANSSTFLISELSHIAHLRKFEFMFLLVVYSWRFTHSIALLNNEGEVLTTLAFRNFKNKDLRKFIQAILNKNNKVSLDPAIKDFVETGSKTKLTLNMVKAVVKGLLPWVGVVIGVIIFLALTQ